MQHSYSTFGMCLVTVEGLVGRSDIADVDRLNSGQAWWTSTRGMATYRGV
jgi:hypothetical protein